MTQLQVCDTKTLYDTEFAAEIAARKSEVRYDSPMHHYSCFGRGGVSSPHWHIAHLHKYHRRGAGKGYIKCPDCKLILRDKYNALQRHHCVRSVTD